MATLKQQKARKEYKCSKCGKKIEKGEQYLRFSLTRFHKPEPRCLNCRPKQSEMTSSDFLSQVWSIDETIQDMTADDVADGCLDDIKSELENLQSETEDKVGNMPDNLQSSPVAEMLQNRADSVQEMIDSLDSIELEVDEEEIKSEVERDKDDSEEEYQEKVEEAIKEKKEEILSEIQGVSYNGE